VGVGNRVDAGIGVGVENELERLLAQKWGQDLILELVLEYGLKLALVAEWGLETALMLNWRLELVLRLG
jgi:hypothetical protein